MSGGNWAEAVEAARPPAAAQAGRETEPNLAPNEADFASLSQEGAVALAASSASEKRCLRALSTH